MPPQHLADLPQPDVVVVHPGAGRHEADPLHAVGEDLRVISGQRHRHHPAEGMTHEDDRPVRGKAFEHEQEVVGEPFDRHWPGRPLRRVAVTAHVPEDHSHIATHREALVVPVVPVLQIAVSEHHGQALGVRLGQLVDFGEELHAVVSGHPHRRGAQRAGRVGDVTFGLTPHPHRRHTEALRTRHEGAPQHLRRRAGRSHGHSDPDAAQFGDGAHDRGSSRPAALPAPSWSVAAAR
jgi:hypothetical protein